MKNITTTKTTIKLPGEEFRSFYTDIDQLVESSGVSYLDAIIEWTGRRGIEVEHVAFLIMNKPELLAKLQCEAEDLRFLRKTTRVPI